MLQHVSAYSFFPKGVIVMDSHTLRRVRVLNPLLSVQEAKFALSRLQTETESMTLILAYRDPIWDHTYLHIPPPLETR